MTDTEWLALMKKSPKKAREELIGEYGSLVYAIVLNKLRGCAAREEIEDCVSDVFVELFRSTDKFSDIKGSLKSYISAVAKYTAINAFKRIACRQRNTLSMEEENVKLPPVCDSPEEDMQKKLFRKRLWEIVDSLGEPDTSIIVYQYYYDLPVREIAERLSMTAAAVQKRSIRARERIRKILTDEDLL